MIIKFLISKLIIVLFISISYSEEIKISSESLMIDREIIFQLFLEEFTLRKKIWKYGQTN